MGSVGNQKAWELEGHLKNKLSKRIIKFNYTSRLEFEACFVVKHDSKYTKTQTIAQSQVNYTIIFFSDRIIHGESRLNLRSEPFVYKIEHIKCQFLSFKMNLFSNLSRLFRIKELEQTYMFLGSIHILCSKDGGYKFRLLYPIYSDFPTTCAQA